MAKEITFPNADPQYRIFALTFPARVDGKSVECLVTAEFLVSRFDAGDGTEEELRQAYQEHRVEIQALARTHIENGWIDEDNRVSLTKRFTKLHVTFGENLELMPDGRAIAEREHRILSAIIGPSAETVNVEWNANADLPDSPKISVKISDPTTERSITGSFDPKQLADPTMSRLTLAGLWSFILRERSRKLSLQAG